MKTFYLTATLLTILSIAPPAEAEKFQHTLKAKLIPRPDNPPSIFIFYDGALEAQTCKLESPITTEGSLICTEHHSRTEAPKVARIMIQASGFKRYTRNIADLSYLKTASPILKAVEYKARLDLGEIRLSASELPRVEQILLSTAPDGSNKFDLILSNPLKKNLLVKNISIEALRPGTDSDCCCPPTAVFVLSDTITINAGSSIRMEAAGKFKEMKRGKDYLIASLGEITLDPCKSLAALSLKLPTGFSLSNSDFTSIQIILPPRITIQSSHYSFGTDGDKPDPDSIKSGSVEIFKEFRFALKTSDEAEPEIVGTYRK